MTMNYTQALAICIRELKSQEQLADMEGSRTGLHTPLLLGPQGIGKTALAHALSAHFDRPLLSANCGEISDTTELVGMMIPAATRRVGDIAMLEFGLPHVAALACTQPCLVLFDDLDKAPTQSQGALLSIIGSRMIRNHKIHPRTLLMCAGNAVDDDMYANDISESLRTRLTIIAMEADLKSFTAYGVEKGTIHPAVLGFLQWKPALLHQRKLGVTRFPTPRCWEEVSYDFFAETDPYSRALGTPSAWKTYVELRCGPEVANDFWAWWEVVRGVDITDILATGGPALGDEDAMRQYASVYAVTGALNSTGVRRSHAGLPAFVAQLSPEMRAALYIQLGTPARQALQAAFPDAAMSLMQDIVA